MSLCYDFQKWTMITFASIAISLTIGLVSIVYGQESRPSIGELEAGGQIVDHNKELLERMTSINQKCASDILSKDFSTFQACINFQKTLEKNLMKIFNESASDIEQISPLETLPYGQTDDNNSIISNTGKEINVTEFNEKLTENIKKIKEKIIGEAFDKQLLDNITSNDTGSSVNDFPEALNTTNVTEPAPNPTPSPNLDMDTGTGYYDPPYSYTQCLTVFTKEMCDFRFNSD